MVEKKFNFYKFYNIYYKIYYKNVNESVESVFFYDYNTFQNFESGLYATRINKFLVNYIGIFYILTSNLIKYSDLFIFKTILKNRNPLMWADFKIKKIFYKTSIINYHSLKNKNTNSVLIFLENYN